MQQNRIASKKLLPLVVTSCIAIASTLPILAFAGSQETLIESTSTPPPQISIIYGDANGDSKVDSADYTLLRRALLLGVDLPNPNWRTTMDLNKDKKIDSADYLLLRKYLRPVICEIGDKK